MVGKLVSVYGYCPICGAPGQKREKRPNGNDICAEGHKYPSRSASPRCDRDDITRLVDAIVSGTRQGERARAAKALCELYEAKLKRLGSA